ncbi:hypothetical protein [Streptomyces sp. HM190]|uniref:hypothetical protein n=1 Tax=Streptomyces sp. HM190 TaxID=2695266 RepID=UPI001356A814|nr:hypothetical protein [Streptomyces sp. HM190]
MEQYDLTEAQQKAFEDNRTEFRKFEDQLDGVREAARSRLRDSGWHPDSVGTFSCLSCPCPHFQPGGPQGECKRGSCRHALLDHDRAI